MARALTPKVKAEIRRSNTEMVLSTLILMISLFMAGCCAAYGIATGNFMTAAVPMAFAVIFAWLVTPTLLFNCLWIATRSDEFAGRYAQVELAYSRLLALLAHWPHGYSTGIDCYVFAQIARMKMLRGEYRGAEEFNRRALTAAAGSTNPRFPDQHRYNPLPIICRYNTINNLLAQNKVDEASMLLNEIDWPSAGSQVPPTMYDAYDHLAAANVAVCSEQPDTAEQHLLAAQKLFDHSQRPRALPQWSVRQSAAWCQLMTACLYAKRADWDKSHAAFTKFIDGVAEDPSILLTCTLKRLTELAAAYLAHGDMQRPEQLLKLAYATARDFTDHPDAKSVLDCYEQLLVASNRQEQVTDMRLWLQDVQ